MKYRPDIDGLRAFAVIVVVWFHAGLGGASGGFIGVDVFFVISGFLIGGIIIDETRNRSFSYVQFYTRRAKRLFAAFFVVSLASVIAGWWLLLPGDFRHAGKTLAAAALAFSNVVFYRDMGYFDSAAITKPWLHSWSLSVEEQFYLFFPVLMIAVLRIGQRVQPVVLVVAALASLAGAQYLLAGDPGASFYMLPARAWELALGAMVALPQAKNVKLSRYTEAVLTCLAVVGLCAPVLLYTEHTSFPGLAALPSCLGTTWLLWHGARNPDLQPYRALRAPVPVFIGKISYSLYLWHWPVIVYMTYWAAGEMGWPERIMVVLLSFGFAVLSWRYVERPIRQSNRPAGHILGVTGGGILLLAVIGVAVWRLDGIPGRLSTAARMLADAATDFNQPRPGCFDENNPMHPGIAFCEVGRLGVAPEFLVWGDSHVTAMREGIDMLAAERGLGGLIVHSGGCMPAFDVIKHESASTPSGDQACATQNRAIRDLLASGSLPIRNVLLIGRWAYYAEGTGIGADAHNTIHLERADHQGSSRVGELQSDLVAESMRDTVLWLRERGLRVYVLQQMPEIPYFGSRVLFQRVRSGRESYNDAMRRIGTVPRADVEARQRRGNAAIEIASAGGAATVIPTHGVFCNAYACSAELNFGPAYFDNNHLRATTARAIRRLFAPIMEE